jgi:two-component system, NarL family, invasion response regulator UvrY
MKIGLVDDHSLIRDYLRIMFSKIETDDVVLEAGNGVELMNKLAELEVERLPDVLIIDISMPIMDGFESVSLVRSNYPSINIIVLTMRDDENSIIRMVRLGVKSYLTKHGPTENIHTALKMVADQKSYFPDDITDIIVNFLKKEGQVDKDNLTAANLTEREIQFLKLSCGSQTYPEIAKEMGLSVRTIDGYREALFSKFGVKSRVGLVLAAIKAEIIEI